MNRIDDYDMLDKDIEGSMRYGRECFEAERIATDERRDLSERIRARAEIIYRQETGVQAAVLPERND